MGNFKDEIRRYLKAEKISDELIEHGIRQSEDNSLQLSNPMSGVFVMGIPIAAQTTRPVEGPAPVPKESAPAVANVQGGGDPVACTHQYRHFVCAKCGEKAPKPILASRGTKKQDQYTYEYYSAANAEEAKHFLELTQVLLPLHYVMVETPEGKWGRDKDGIFLETLCAFQRNLSLAQCEASTALFPQRMQDMQLAAKKITDNFLLSVTCGSCGYQWTDGVAYRSKTIVKCPECGKYNLADTEHIRLNSL
jgi:predicted RNA-binding Zn-ribbon protein involved in translation (DUF1610 family)